MIDSIHSNGIPVPPEGRPVEKAGNEPRPDAVRTTGNTHNAEAEPARDTKDKIELSDAARRLANEAADVSGSVNGSGTISPGRLSTITKRLREDFYDTKAVRNEIARRLLPDLRSQTGE